MSKIISSKRLAKNVECSWYLKMDVSNGTQIYIFLTDNDLLHTWCCVSVLSEYQLAKTLSKNIKRSKVCFTLNSEYLRKY